MPRQRASSNASDPSLAATDGDETQELGSMYDYLAKIILLGPSGAGKSCLLHRFLRSSFPPLTSQTIGVEFGSKIISIGTGTQRTRLKLQLWDTAGTERFRAVSRSYYRGAAGALLIYDVSSWSSFAGLGTFLRDARALGSPRLSVVLVGNKVDVEEEEIAGAGRESTAPGTGTSAGTGLGLGMQDSRPSTRAHSLRSEGQSFMQADSTVWGTATAGEGSVREHDDSDDEWDRRTARGVSIPYSDTPATPARSTISQTPSSASSSRSAASVETTSTVRYALPGQSGATVAPQGREVDSASASKWASSQSITVSMGVSALSGAGVEEAFERLARIILTKIELGEIDPDDPQSGIQYGDRGWWDGDAGSEIDGSSNRGGSTLRRRRGKGGRSGTSAGLREWEAVFKIDGSRGKRRGCC